MYVHARLYQMIQITICITHALIEKRAFAVKCSMSECSKNSASNSDTVVKFLKT
jgi:hypothetical protein